MASEATGDAAPTDTNYTDPDKIRCKEWLTFLFCLLESLVFGATLFGWPSLAYVYEDIGVYSCGSNQTQNGTESCSDGIGMLPLAFNVGAASFCLTSVLAGLGLDRFGLRPVRITTVFIGILGTLCLAFCSRQYPFLIFPGAVFVGAACGCMVILNNYAAQVMRTRAPAVIVIYNGAFNSSGVIYFIVKVAYDSGFSQQWMLIIIACSWIFVLLNTIFLLPAHKIDHNTASVIVSPEGTPKDSLWQCIQSPAYLVHLLYVLVNYLLQGVVLGTMNLWLATIYEGNQAQVSYYVNIYAYIQLASGILLCPLTGGLTDLVRKGLQRTEGKVLLPSALAVIAAPGLLLASIFYVVAAIALLVAQTWSVWLVFIFHELGRAFFHGSIAAYVSLVFPLQHFGALNGLLYGACTVTLAIQYGYIQWTKVSGFVPVVSLTLGLTSLSALHPASVLVRYMCDKRTQSNRVHQGKPYEYAPATRMHSHTTHTYQI